MQWKGNPPDLDIVFSFESINTSRTEVTPGSDIVGKYFQNERFVHELLPPFLPFTRSEKSPLSCQLKGLQFITISLYIEAPPSGWGYVHRLSYGDASG
jgi:hypothetical protein